MQNIGTTLTAGSATPFHQKGTVLQVLSSGDSAGLTVQFLRGSQVAYTVYGVLTGWKLRPQGGFDSITIESATADTISAIVTGGDVDIQVLENVSTISNTSANPVNVEIVGGVLATSVAINNTSAAPVPVSLVSEPGAPIPVQVDPPASSTSDQTPATVGTSGAQILAAGARKEIRFRNAGNGQLGLTAATGTTFANAAVVLQPGDTWIETTAPQVAWFAVSDVGTTANMQVLS